MTYPVGDERRGRLEIVLAHDPVRARRERGQLGMLLGPLLVVAGLAGLATLGLTGGLADSLGAWAVLWGIASLGLAGLGLALTPLSISSRTAGGINTLDAIGTIDYRHQVVGDGPRAQLSERRGGANKGVVAKVRRSGLRVEREGQEAQEIRLPASGEYRVDGSTLIAGEERISVAGIDKTSLIQAADEMGWGKPQPLEPVLAPPAITPGGWQQPPVSTPEDVFVQPYPMTGTQEPRSQRRGGSVARR